MLRRIVFAVAAVVHLLLADQIVKEVAVRLLRNRPPVEVVPGFFNLAYVENYGCAWGMFQGQVWPLAGFAVLALAFLVWKRRTVFPAGRLGAVVEVMLYAGIVGNLIDRVARGCVVDMFDVHWGARHFPCFNVADSYITVAAAALVLLGLFQKQGAEGEGGGGDGRA